MGDVISALGSKAPPGVSEMLDYYADACKAIGDAINQLITELGKANRDAALAGGLPSRHGADIPYSPEWGQKIVDDAAEADRAADPMNEPSSGGWDVDVQDPDYGTA